MSDWDRRSFLLGAASAATAAAATGLIQTGCAGSALRYNGPTLDDVLAQGPRVMWCAAHPDDECFSGSIMAKSRLVLNNPLFLLVLTHGDGGECNLPEGCHPDLAHVRGEEMKKVAELYKAELQHESFYNAPLPVSKFPKRHEIAKKWKDLKDPTRVCAEAIRRFKPDLLLTFEPVHGATGHPEHQLASRFATAGVRMAADSSAVIGELPPHRVQSTYYLVNRLWLYVVSGNGDPGSFTEEWDPRQPCVNGKNCLDTMAEFTKMHRTQINDMGAVRKYKWMIGKLYLRKVDPMTEICDPYEVVL